MANANAAASSSSTKNDDEIKIWVKSIEKERRGVCLFQSGCSIFRVPKYLKNINQEVYTPQLVSIGPLHYGEEHLQSMQAHKLRYLNSFLDRHEEKISLDDYVKAVSELEEEARKCYSETIGRGFEKDEFVKMMVIDGCFILELFEIVKNGEKDDLFLNRSWFQAVLNDLLTLENQLPFFVLERLYGLIYELQTLTKTFNQAIYDELLGWFDLHDPSNEQLNSVSLLEGGAKHLLDLLRSTLIDSSTTRKDTKKHLVQTSCASELKRAGVKFQKMEPTSSNSPKTSFLDIDFDMNKGVLTIPTISIFDETEHTLRNLIAFEQGQEDITPYFTAYAAFMDGLIDTRSDVELLQEKGIIVNNIGNPEDVVTLFNNIVKRVTLKDPYFSGVIQDVGYYHNILCNKWLANLKQNYFNTPWALISFLAALILLILTVGQTICSILQLAWTKH